MDKKAEQLLSAAYSLHKIHLGTAKLQHAIRENAGEKWEVYFPTHFIYAFFAFNSLYNVDWKASYDSGHIISVPKVRVRTERGPMLVEEKEGNKQGKYLSFCFKDTNFVKIFKDFFIRCVLKGDKVEDVKEILSEIKRDNGSVRNEGYVRRFQIAVDDLLCHGRFVKDTIEIILDFIYSVRCNIFHGIKSVEEMKDYGQQDRLDVYASLIIALNQMVFSYLEFLDKGESIKDKFDELYESLMC